MPSANEIKIVRNEISMRPDIAGSATIVFWRNVPVGFVRELRRIPRIRGELSSDERDAHRQQFKPLLGKWYSTLVDVGYHGTKEEAAVQIVRHLVNTPSQIECSPLLQAAIRDDQDEIERLLQAIRSAVTDQMP